jgi:Ca-activated chloride channel family protein
MWKSLIVVTTASQFLMAGCTRPLQRDEEPLPPVHDTSRPDTTMRKEPVPPPPPPAPKPAVEEQRIPALAPSESEPPVDEIGLESPALAGVPGDTVGGVPGGTLGGIVGGLPTAAPSAAIRAYAMREKARVGHALSPPARYVCPMNTEAYDRIRDNGFRAVLTNPLSTFSVDVDTASYANVRRFLERGQLPPRDAVRIEELINYFRYDYPQPEAPEPFSVSTEVFDCPWDLEHRLVSIGLQGRLLEADQIPPRNLVFLLDVSGSMASARKLPLLKAAMRLLVHQLRAEDRVAVVVYAGSSGLALASTPGDRKVDMVRALERLEAGGSTAGGAGIQLAYDVAAESFIPGGINRVILATDGDFNIGITNQGDLVRLIERERESGVFLSVLGFGEGNLKDSTMEKLADSGNGNYAYIDSLSEARKVLVREAGATLVTIAKDVKIQVEFNPARVSAYRLIGYENRVLAAEDFKDDRKDAGEIGAGHSVTALYEIVPAGVAITLPTVDPLKYQPQPRVVEAHASDELLTVKLRYKDPDGEVSRPLSVAVEGRIAEAPSANARFAAAVAGFGMLLRDSEHRGNASWSDVLQLARGAVGPDPEGYRQQFCRLVEVAEALATTAQISAAR